MARTASVLSGGARLTDYLGVGVIASVFPLDAVRAALKETGRESRRIRLIPAEVMVYYVICLGLFRTVSTGEVLRCLVDGLRRAGVSFPGIPVAKRASISEARIRLGVAPLTALRRRVVGCIAERGSAGSWYRGRRLVALDGSSFSLPDERPLAGIGSGAGGAPAAALEAGNVVAGRPGLQRLPLVGGSG